jgi:hypothetical protein
VGFDEGVVDCDDIDFIILDGISEDDTADTAETVDANLCWAHDCYGRGGSWRVISLDEHRVASGPTDMVLNGSSAKPRVYGKW